MADFESITRSITDLDEDTLFKALRAVVADEPEAASEALDACRIGLEAVGQRFESQEYFLSDLIYGGELMTDAVEILKPALAEAGGASLGKVLIATVKGDLHDIGKNIVIVMLDAAGFDVIDLGVDVPAADIVKAAKDNDIRLIGLSALLTLAVDSLKDTVDAFVEAGMRDQVKIIIGGNPVSAPICEFVGADAWTHSPQEGVNVIRGWAGE